MQIAICSKSEQVDPLSPGTKVGKQVKAQETEASVSPSFKFTMERVHSPIGNSSQLRTVDSFRHSSLSNCVLSGLRGPGCSTELVPCGELMSVPPPSGLWRYAGG
jgi:hypothetical protein